MVWPPAITTQHSVLGTLHKWRHRVQPSMQTLQHVRYEGRCQEFLFQTNIEYLFFSLACIQIVIKGYVPPPTHYTCCVGAGAGWAASLSRPRAVAAVTSGCHVTRGHGPHVTLRDSDADM